MSDSSERSPKIAIFVLDEQPLLRYGISAYLNSQPDMMVCGEAESLLNARSRIAGCQPHLLLTALRLGAGDSLKMIKKLRTENAEMRILGTPRTTKIFSPSAPCARERTVT
jgi:two-component system, NarL family, response regulator DevR